MLLLIGNRSQSSAISSNAERSCPGERQLRGRATVLGLGSGRPDHLAGLVDAVFGHSVMEDSAETEIPPRLDSGGPGRSQLIEKALEAQILGQLVERLVVRRELQ